MVFQTKSSSQTKTHVEQMNQDIPEQNDLDSEMLKDYAYPDIDDNFQYNLFRKTEFLQYYNQRRKKIPDTWEELVEARKVCNAKKISPTKEQLYVANFISTATPYKSLLLKCGPGFGKTLIEILCCFNFLERTRKYHTKPVILVTGPTTKDNTYNEFLKFKGDYFGLDLTPSKPGIPLTDDEKQRRYDMAKQNVKQVATIITLKSFTKKVIGERVTVISDKDGKPTKRFKKNEKGEEVRNLSPNRLTNLDNTILFIDEAHNITETEAGLSVKEIIKNSVNLVIILMTATPIKNFGDEIVELMNYIRPLDDPIVREKVFTGRDLNLQFKKDKNGREIGKEYLTKMCNGYVYYIRGGDLITFPEKIDVGTIPDKLLFTKLVRCEMRPFQLQVYQEIYEQNKKGLGTKPSAAANFVFPGFNNGELAGFFGNDGVESIKIQLQSNKNFVKDLQKYFPGINIKIKSGETGTVLSGNIFHKKYLSIFSAKIFQLLSIIENFYWVDKVGKGLAFVSSDLVEFGTKLLEEMFIENGFLKYMPDGSGYAIGPHTVCYRCGVEYDKHAQYDLDDEEDSDDVNHKFYPAAFLTITGKKTDSDSDESIVSNKKKRIIDQVANSVENKHGKFIKVIIGSAVTNEGLTIRNGDLGIALSAKFTINSLIQIMGRIVRFCSANNLVTKDNPMPKVYSHKLVIAYPHDDPVLRDELTNEEVKFQQAEIKYKIIVQVFQCIHAADIACPNNHAINANIEDIEKYKDCVPITELEKLSVEERKHAQICPEICNFGKCEYKCACKKLNDECYDEKEKMYVKPRKSELDNSTFMNSSFESQIDYSRKIIMDLFKYNYVMHLAQIVAHVRQAFIDDGKAKQFKKWYVDNALTSLIPETNNEFNNFVHTIVNKFEDKGYLIYCDRYYVFQPMDLQKNVPLWHRENKHVMNQPELEGVSLNDFLEQFDIPSKRVGTVDVYDFESTDAYYESRVDNDFVGTVDKPSNKKNAKKASELEDVFKIRNAVPENVQKKRQEGLPKRGRVCGTGGNVSRLKKVAKSIGLDKVIFNTDSKKGAAKKKERKKYMKQEMICKLLYQRMYELEKYTDNGKNYLVVPGNHPTIPFPLNLHDRVDELVKDVNKLLGLSKNYKPKVIKNDYDDLPANDLKPAIKYCEYTITWPADTDVHSLFGKSENRKILDHYKVQFSSSDKRNVLLIK